MITDQRANCTNETSKTSHKGKYRTLSFLIELNKFCVIFFFLTYSLRFQINFISGKNDTFCCTVQKAH